ncbi:uncharacterized protein LOC112559447 isoform X2 [Pomacea canaliculata]|nr:uncharacterized protein LOC112559447 isoform X2 [Pomacea canaliculata]XP_025086507.1 uncharacterized protein LOC112559447 isoform X2 [Pomacea canaliculata]
MHPGGLALVHYLIKTSGYILKAPIRVSRSAVYQTAVKRLVEQISGPWIIFVRPSSLRNFCHSTKLCEKARTSKRQAKETTTKVAISEDEHCQVFDASEKLIGQMTIKEAETVAKKDNLKLVDIGTNQDGVRSFRLLSGKELAEESIRFRTEEKNKKPKEKEFRIMCSINDHDLEIKTKQAKEAVGRGDHVKFIIKPRKKTAEDVADRQMAEMAKKIITGMENLGQIKYGIRNSQEVHLLLRPLGNTEENH